MSDAEFIREVEELYLLLANADTDDLVELAKLAGLDPKTDLAYEDSAGQASSAVWVPWSAADQDQANKLAQAHPNPTFGELIRQNTLAAVVLTHYLDDHGIEMDHAAADHTQAVLQLLNPTADVVLSKLGKLEALLVPQDSGTETFDLRKISVEIDLNPANLAYIIVQLDERGAWLLGVLLSSEIGRAHV